MTNAETPYAGPKDAATLIVLRDGMAGLEVFMTRRAPTMAFAPNAMVFPGGKVDEADHFNAAEDPLRPFQNAVLREAFEEVGLLLARQGDQVISKTKWQNLLVHRAPIAQRSLPFDGFLKRERLTPDYNALTYISRWITPPKFPKRFDTRFFVATLPESQHLAHDGSEAVHSEWVTPRALLQRADIGADIVFPPTFWMLKDLAIYDNARSAIQGMEIAHFDPDSRNLQT